jgi:heparanase
MSSFATSPGTRGLDGTWTPEQARKLLAYTKSVGGSIAAAEFMNEPTFAAIGGAPKGYDASTYGRDVAVFSRFIKEAAPEMVFLGPGSVGEGASLGVSSMPSMLKSEDLLKATGPVYDVFSYHLYAGVSKRCAGAKAASPESALSEDWLSRSDKITTYYADLRDRFEPGKPLWLTETADAACGGNPWASTFLDTFRYLDQHGRLAQRSVQIIAHNTLASSDYGLLDETTLNPRPNYWAALLWQKLMGTTVLNPGASSSPSVHLYAQCLRAHPGGVALLALNIDQQAAHEISLPIQAERYTLTAKEPQDTSVQLNGKTLEAGRDGSVPALSSVQAQAGRVKLEPTSVTFLAIPEAGNSSCQ